VCFKNVENDIAKLNYHLNNIHLCTRKHNMNAASDMKYAVHTHCKNIAATFCKKRATQLLETHLQAPITPSEKHLERNHVVPGWPGAVGATLEPSGFSPSVSQRELWELEGGFQKVELHASCRTLQIALDCKNVENNIDNLNYHSNNILLCSIRRYEVCKYEYNVSM
jgi:hypothetical protein